MTLGEARTARDGYTCGGCAGSKERRQLLCSACMSRLSQDERNTLGSGLEGFREIIPLVRALARGFKIAERA
jgi:hypothetical protein